VRRNVSLFLVALLLSACGPSLPVAPVVKLAKGSHGGQLQQSGTVSVELTAKISGETATVDVYVNDRNRQPVIPGATTAQFIAEDGHAHTIKLAVQADHLECLATLDDKGEYSVVILGTVSGASLKAVFSISRP
jgi:hypothetical protein